MKTAFVKILKEYRLEPSASTPAEIVVNSNAAVMQPEKPLLLNFVRDPLL